MWYHFFLFTKSYTFKKCLTLFYWHLCNLWDVFSTHSYRKNFRLKPVTCAIRTHAVAHKSFNICTNVYRVAFLMTPLKIAYYTFKRLFGRVFIIEFYLILACAVKNFVSNVFWQFVPRGVKAKVVFIHKSFHVCICNSALFSNAVPPVRRNCTLIYREIRVRHNKLGVNLHQISYTRASRTRTKWRVEWKTSRRKLFNAYATVYARIVLRKNVVAPSNFVYNY